MTDDRRLIEDYLPIEAISKEASREKSVRKGHISTLHLWWARRPLVACRAAVYGALVPADRWVKQVNLKNPPADPAKAESVANGKKKGLNRKAAGEFVTRLCRYPKDSDPAGKADIERAVREARGHIWEAHAERLTRELAEARRLPSPSQGEGRGEGRRMPAWVEEFKWPVERESVTADDIADGRAPRPRVLDMFAGGGAIPLEALRLGCEAYALDLNPVAHIIQLCTLVYPQKYGKPDPTARGMTGKPRAAGKPTWGGLAAEVRYWGKWVLERVRKEIGDLYPLIPDPKYKPGRDDATASNGASGKQVKMQTEDDENGDDESAAENVPPGYLIPVAYLWTRTVRCKNPSCAATVPLVKQTWLCKKTDRYVALKVVAPKGTKTARFVVVESRTEKELGFDPELGSTAGNATCPFCGTVADSDYVKAEGHAGRLAFQPMAVVAAPTSRAGKSYFSADDLPGLVPSESDIRQRIDGLCKATGLTVPTEPIVNDAKSSFWVTLYGFRKWGDMFSPRQQLCLLAFAASARIADTEMRKSGHEEERAKAVATYLGGMVDKLADFNSVQCTWNYTGGRGVKNSFARQALGMTWDCAETNPFNEDAASWPKIVEDIPAAIEMLTLEDTTAPRVQRGSALSTSWPDACLDAVITDPPYYDNVSYADLSDFFYVWLKRTVGQHFLEHFANEGTPKKTEAVADAVRHNGDKRAANVAYESMMATAFSEANRVLKPGGLLAVVYAHKTTLGWSTLVDAMRRSGFVVVEAWPLDTEMKARMLAMDTAALASSIFLVARKRSPEPRERLREPRGGLPEARGGYSQAGVGNYEVEVQPELALIVRERVETLWEMGIAGADLVIACVGAGLRAFTKYEKVEYANGEEVPAEKFLAEVEGVVLDTILRRLSREAGANGGKMTLAGVDEPTRFYVLWRYAYRAATLDAGEAIVFANGTHVELDGPQGVSGGRFGLVEKNKSKYRLRDFSERGTYDNLGLPDDGRLAPLIDVLHRAIWLMEHSPRKLAEFLNDARPDRERLRMLAQALAGPALSGKRDDDTARLVSTTPAEQAALAKLLANWKSLVPESLFDARHSK